MRMRRGGLRRRIVLAVTLGMSVILLSFGVISYYIVNKSIEDSLNQKLAFGRLVRNKIDNIITDNINRLYDISLSGAVSLDDDNLAPERAALDTAYRYSIFSDGIFLLDSGGNMVLHYPEKIKETHINLLSIEPVSRMVATGRPVVSNLYTAESVAKKVLFMLVPLKDRNGNYAGIAGGEIDPTNPVFTDMLKTIDVRKAFIDLIDSNGMIIASSNPSRAFTHCDHNEFFSNIIASKKERVATCHQCHDIDKKRKSTNIVAVVPFETAPWGITIQEPEEDVFAPSIQLKRTFALLGVIFLGTAVMLAVGISRSVVNPVNELIAGADRIAGGDLSMPVPISGSDELGSLGQSFEVMRVRLAGSLEDIKHHNLELENRVRERTSQIRESRKRIRHLLDKILSTQEEERKRIARELHDVTIQELSAILMRVDMCRIHPEEITPRKIEEIRGIVFDAIVGVRAITQNLRPSVLDDLGLEAAIRRLLDTTLAEKKINYFLNIAGTNDRRFGIDVEIRLYRIIQEAVMNISRHAGAENVILDMTVTKESISVLIEDDGEGFDVDALMHRKINYENDGRGLGLIGMKERASLLNGSLHVRSSPGNGTRITLQAKMMSDDVRA
ncbi:MAG: HAMP domain-containing protein [Nitrospirae bacterium]|nr:HAMP domain-containing protein [Nitrospirota bacterium]